MTTYGYIESNLGRLLLCSREDKLTGLYFADRPHAPKPAPDWTHVDNLPLFQKVARQLEEFSTGERRDFDIPLGLSGTPFRVGAWNAIAKIPFGQTISYSALATRIGSPDAVRAVGTATGANPISWIVPCHRIVGKGGAMTGFAGGLPRKQALLDFESGKSDQLAPDSLILG